MPPTGWTLDGLQAQWSIGNSSNSGGLAPEGKFSYVKPDDNHQAHLANV